VTDDGPLLHITTAAPWRVALEAGSLVTPSLVAPPAGTEGFVHLSRPDQVALPANRLYAGRDDLLLLVVDPARLTDPVRWEPGVPGDPESMRFPHLYGPLPAAAVTAVVPWWPGPDGAFSEPTGLPAPDDRVARAAGSERRLAERRAAAVVHLDGATAVLDPRIPASYEHNSLWLDAPLAAADLRALADRVLGRFDHRRVVAEHPLPTGLGGDLDEERLMVLGPDVATPPPSTGVEAVTTEVMARLWGPAWRREVPGIGHDAVADLIRREPLNDAHVRVVDLAVLDGDRVPIASTQLRVDGATAEVTAVMTDPAHRGRGLATAVVLDAVRRAREAGCDVIWLHALADDWPRGWYERLGFEDAGVRWVASWHPR